MAAPARVRALLEEDSTESVDEALTRSLDALEAAAARVERVADEIDSGEISLEGVVVAVEDEDSLLHHAEEAAASCRGGGRCR